MATALKTKPGPAKRKPLGVRVTAEQHRILTEAAQREHRSVSSFVLQAAMHAAQAQESQNPRKSQQELKAIFEAARAKVHYPAGRDLLEEFLVERRQEATRE